MAAINYYKDLSAKNSGNPRIVELDGRPGVKEVSAKLMARLIYNIHTDQSIGQYLG